MMDYCAVRAVLVHSSLLLKTVDSSKFCLRDCLLVVCVAVCLL